MPAKPAKKTEPRPMKDIQTDYASACQHAGDLEAKMRLMHKDLQQTYGTLEALHEEANRRSALDKGA